MMLAHSHDVVRKWKYFFKIFPLEIFSPKFGSVTIADFKAAVKVSQIFCLQSPSLLHSLFLSYQLRQSLSYLILSYPISFFLLPFLFFFLTLSLSISYQLSRSFSYSLSFSVRVSLPFLLSLSISYQLSHYFYSLSSFLSLSFLLSPSLFLTSSRFIFFLLSISYTLTPKTVSENGTIKCDWLLRRSRLVKIRFPTNSDVKDALCVQSNASLHCFQNKKIYFPFTTKH